MAGRPWPGQSIGSHFLETSVLGSFAASLVLRPLVKQMASAVEKERGQRLSLTVICSVEPAPLERAAEIMSQFWKATRDDL